MLSRTIAAGIAALALGTAFVSAGCGGGGSSPSNGGTPTPGATPTPTPSPTATPAPRANIDLFSIEPDRGPATGGNRVTFHGRGFVNNVRGSLKFLVNGANGEVTDIVVLDNETATGVMPSCTIGGNQTGARTTVIPGDDFNYSVSLTHYSFLK